MRSLKKSWQDKRPGWTRRVRWYEEETPDYITIRLNFIDDFGERNEFFIDRVTAQAEYDAFREGHRTAFGDPS